MRTARGKKQKAKIELTLRDYSPTDFDELLALDQQCFVQGIAYTGAELGKYIRRRGAITIVAEDEAGTIAGFLVAHVQRDYGWIVTIDIREFARRTGLGTRLMAAGEERLRAARVSAIVLEVAVNNLGAVGFYKRLGYAITRTIPRYYLDSLDAFQMAKRME